MKRRLPRPISDEDLAYAVASASERIRPWLILAAWCGLRANEVALLKWECVLDTADPPVLLVAADATGYVFRRRDGRPGPNRPWLVSMLANEHLHACGSPATLHQLRHWFGTNTYRAKRDLRVVQELMGHESPTTTAGYAAYDRADAIEAVRALPVPSALWPVVPRQRKPMGLSDMRSHGEAWQKCPDTSGAIRPRTSRVIRTSHSQQENPRDLPRRPVQTGPAPVHPGRP